MEKLKKYKDYISKKSSTTAEAMKDALKDKKACDAADEKKKSEKIKLSDKNSDA